MRFFQIFLKFCLPFILIIISSCLYQETKQQPKSEYASLIAGSLAYKRGLYQQAIAIYQNQGKLSKNSEFYVLAFVIAEKYNYLTKLIEITDNWQKNIIDHKQNNFYQFRLNAFIQNKKYKTAFLYMKDLEKKGEKVNYSSLKIDKNSTLSEIQELIKIIEHNKPNNKTINPALINLYLKLIIKETNLNKRQQYIQKAFKIGGQNLQELYLLKMQNDILLDGKINFNYYQRIIKQHENFTQLKLMLIKTYANFPTLDNISKIKYLLNKKYNDYNDDELDNLVDLVKDLNLLNLIPIKKITKLNTLIKILIAKQKYNQIDKLIEKSHNKQQFALIKLEVYLSKGEIQKSIAIINNLLQNHEKQGIEAKLNLVSYLSSILIKAGYPKKAKDLLQKFKTTNLKAFNQGKNYQYSYALAISNALFEMKEYKKAVEILEEQLNRNPQDITLLNNIGYMKLYYVNSKEEKQQSLALIQKAYKQQPFSDFILDSLGWAYYLLNDNKKAFHYLIRSVMLNYSNESADHLAQVMWQNGKKKGAKLIWYKISLANPNDKFLQQSLKKYNLSSNEINKTKNLVFNWSLFD